jgi:hypothetical protein
MELTGSKFDIGGSGARAAAAASGLVGR